MDRALTGLRDNAVALARGADEDERELIGEVETFIDAIFPVGVAAVKIAGTFDAPPFKDHSLRAKRRALVILNAKSNENRVPLYRELLYVSGKVVGNSERIAESLSGMGLLPADEFAAELRHDAHLTNLNLLPHRNCRPTSLPPSVHCMKIAHFSSGTS